MKLSMFTEADQERAQKQIDCYGYQMKNAIELMAQGEFGKAAAYHQNMALSLDNLQAMKNTKDTHEEINLKISQIKGDQDRMEMLRRNYF